MNIRPKEASAKAIAEFLSEAQDILENLGRDLMTIDEQIKDGEPDPDLVNNLFRGMHTLKSLSAMFGVEPLAKLAHQEENLMEEIRLGRVLLDTKALDLLFESLEVITLILSVVGDSDEVEESEVIERAERFVVQVTKAAGVEEEEKSDSGGEESARDPNLLFGPELLEVLTEYEEHRLNTNFSRGVPIFRICMSFDLESIDVNLENVRTKLKPIGEIITYLPSAEEGDPDKLSIDVIIASKAPKEEIQSILADMDVEIKEMAGAPVSATPEAAEPKPAAMEPLITASPQAVEKEQAPVQRVREIDQSLSMRSISQTVRVDIKKLDHLMNIVGELSIVRAAIQRISDEIVNLVGRGDLTIELHRVNRGFDRRLTSLREGILEVRMVPLKQMFDRLARMVRKISQELEKEIHFVISGAETEVDKLITEELSDPLMHLIRNAIDHGVEEKEVRIKSGKPQFGTVALTAYQKGSHVVIEVEDDGIGIDEARLLEVALERGMIDADQAAAMSQREIMNLVFLPGVSTSKKTTEISGRGVGMDVVKNNIASLGGVIEAQSERNIGTRFSITLPTTLAIIPALLVGIQDITYAIPLNTVGEAIFISQDDICPMFGRDTIAPRGETLVLCHLSDFFGIERYESRLSESCVVVTKIGQRKLGLVVDILYGQQDVVIKSLGSSLDKAVFFSGATDIGEEKLALVIDTSAIIDEFFSGSSGAYLEPGFRQPEIT